MFFVNLLRHISCFCCEFQKTKGMPTMYQTFSKLGDPRVVGRSSHLLSDILTVNGKQTSEDHFHISSLPTNSPSNTCIRSHWEVGNKLHWTLDMTSRENRQRKRCKMTAQNSSLVRKFALNVLKKDKSKLSLVNKRLKAAWNWGYLMQLLQI